MSLQQKQILPDKINKLTIKLKSYAFMKIFMFQDLQNKKKFHKIRHYDLQLEGAAAISCWMKKKLQQVYLRGFLQIKDTQPQLVSLRYIQESPQQTVSPPKIQKLNFKNSNVRSTGKFRSQTDRQHNDKSIKMPSYSTQQLIQKGSIVKVVYRSQYGGQNFLNKKKQQNQNQQSKDKKSNLMSLLDKVRKVNTQSRQDKENYQKNSPVYGLSNQNSRVVSSHSVYGLNNNSNINKSFNNGRYYQQQQTARINTVNHHSNNYNNDLSFCTYGQTQRPCSINNLKSVRKSNNIILNNTQRVSENYTPVTYEMNQLPHQKSMDKSNLLSLKKWQRNQKRNIIMEKINQLQKSLIYADCQQSRQQQDFQYNNNNQIYTSRDYCEIPANYSLGYLNMRTERLPVRSVVEVRVRK